MFTKCEEIWLSTPGVGGYLFRVISFCATVHHSYSTSGYGGRCKIVVLQKPHLCYFKGLSGSKRAMRELQGIICVDLRIIFWVGWWDQHLLSPSSLFWAPLLASLFLWQSPSSSTGNNPPSQLLLKIQNKTKPSTIIFSGEVILGMMQTTQRERGGKKHKTHAYKQKLKIRIKNPG